MFAYQYYAQEKNHKNFDNLSLSVRDFEFIDGKYYTPFSGRFKSEESAGVFLGENGTFWRDRGIILKLIKNERDKDF